MKTAGLAMGGKCPPVIGEYEQAKRPWAIDHVLYADSATSLSVGPPRSHATPKNDAVAASHPMKHWEAESGRSNQESSDALRIGSFRGSREVMAIERKW